MCSCTPTCIECNADVQQQQEDATDTTLLPVDRIVANAMVYYNLSQELIWFSCVFFGRFFFLLSWLLCCFVSGVYVDWLVGC